MGDVQRRVGASCVASLNTLKSAASSLASHRLRHDAASHSKTSKYILTCRTRVASP